MKYGIMTESGKYYIIDEHSRINRLDMKFTPSDNWRCVGFREIRPFGNRGTIVSPAEAIRRGTRFKNGRGRFVLVDYDHGFYREWGDRIVSIWETSGR